MWLFLLLLAEPPDATAAEEKKAQRGDQDEDSDDDEEEEHVVVRFTNRILQYLLKGFLAKDKVVRHRAVSFVAEMISHLGTMECVSSTFFVFSVVVNLLHSDEMYVTLRSSLMEQPPTRSTSFACKQCLHYLNSVGEKTRMSSQTANRQFSQS